MCKNVIIKIVFAIISIMLIIPLANSTVYATDDRHTVSGIFDGADKFINAGQSKTDMGFNEDTMKDMSNLLYNILLVIGIAIAVIVGMVIGIKFMTGSVEEQAKVKQTLVPYVAGCVVLFGAFTIWKIVVTIIQGSGVS